MKIFVVGAHGQMASYWCINYWIEAIRSQGYRDPLTQTPDPEKNFRAVELDLSWPVNRLANLFAGHDAVVFAAGSRGKDLLGVDETGPSKP